MSELEMMQAALDEVVRSTRVVILLQAARALDGHIGIQSTNGVGWIPDNSLAGAARYLRHLALDAGTP